MTEQEVLDAIAEGRVTYNEPGYQYEMIWGKNIHKWVSPLAKKTAWLPTQKAPCVS